MQNTILPHTPNTFHSRTGSNKISQHVVNMPKIIRFVYSALQQNQIPPTTIKFVSNVQEKGRQNIIQMRKDTKVCQVINQTKNQPIEKKTRVPRSISLIIKQKVGMKFKTQENMNNKYIQGYPFKFASHISFQDTFEPLTCNVVCCSKPVKQIDGLDDKVSSLMKPRPTHRAKIFSQFNNSIIREFQQITCEKSQNSSKVIKDKQRKNIFAKKQIQFTVVKQKESTFKQLDIPPVIAQSWARIQRELAKKTLSSIKSSQHSQQRRTAQK